MNENGPSAAVERSRAREQQRYLSKCEMRASNVQNPRNRIDVKANQQTVCRNVVTRRSQFSVT